MKLIPSKFIETSATGEDIFSYFRSYFKVTNPHEAGLVTIKASSTFTIGDDYRSDVSTLIREDDGTRWVSEGEKNASFSINFYSNYVSLSSYLMNFRYETRYIKYWDVFGIIRGKKYLIDRRINETFTTNKWERTYYCQHPGFYNKFMFVLTGPDSLSENMLSMSNLKFYGIISQNHALITNQNRCFNKNRIASNVKLNVITN